MILIYYCFLLNRSTSKTAGNKKNLLNVMSPASLHNFLLQVRHEVKVTVPFVPGGANDEGFWQELLAPQPLTVYILVFEVLFGLTVRTLN